MSENSLYSVVFDCNSTCWRPQRMYNDFFLKSIQNYFNDRLKLKGYVFLNEVLDGLGIKRTVAGQSVGWIDGKGDEGIDFRIKPVFETGKGDQYILDFNVQGVILDILE